MHDKEKITRLFNDLSRFLHELETLGNLTLQEYLNDSRNIYSGRYLLQVSIETCISIGNHIVSRFQLGLPGEYAEIFKLLGTHKIISDNLVSKFFAMIRFRNRLVHIYWDIDDNLIFKFIKEDIKDFHDFKTEISRFLDHQT
jgi:uncharacterized protein YutE (UPF0331/DUF86 family)